MILVVSASKVVVGILFVTLSILVLVIAYRKLLAYLGRGTKLKEKYCVLHSIEKSPASGELEFYFSCEEEKHVDFEILNENFENLKSLSSQIFDKGNHILRFDSTQLSNGIYYYQLRTDNQKTYKKLILEN
jgi:hypothetical protein